MFSRTSLSRLYCAIASSLIAIAAVAPLRAELIFVEHGLIESTGSDPLAPTLTKVGGTANFSVVGGNGGDYQVDFGPGTNHTTGAMITTVTENGRGTDYGIAMAARYETSSPTFPVHTDGNGVAEYFIPISRAGSSSESNSNVAAAYFPFDKFLGGFAYNSTNSGPITELISSPGITLSNEFRDVGNGTFTVDLTGLGASSQDGILLVTGAKNENNFALSRANAGGTFTVFNHDVNANGAGYEQDPVGFVYLDNSETGVIFGRVDGNAGISASSDISGFSIAKSPTAGEWFLSINGHTDQTGTLIISPAGGESFNVDNFITYEFDPANSRWVVQSRDLNAPLLQGTGTEDAFSFAFFANTVPEPGAWMLVGAVGCILCVRRHKENLLTLIREIKNS